jgi:hypothetical protein
MSRWSDVKTNVFAFVVSLIDDSRRLAGSGSRSLNGVAELADEQETSDSSIIIHYCRSGYLSESNDTTISQTPV